MPSGAIWLLWKDPWGTPGSPVSEPRSCSDTHLLATARGDGSCLRGVYVGSPVPFGEAGGQGRGSPTRSWGWGPTAPPGLRSAFHSLCSLDPLPTLELTFLFLQNMADNSHSPRPHIADGEVGARGAGADRGKPGARPDSRAHGFSPRGTRCPGRPGPKGGFLQRSRELTKDVRSSRH